MMFQGLKQFFLVLTVATGAAAQGNPAGAWGGPLDSCVEQANCVSFTIEKADAGAACGTGCEFKVCMTLNLGGSCPKSSDISHSCIKQDDKCCPAPGLNGATNTGSIGSHTQCQIKPPGTKAHFLLKDGNTCVGTASSGGASCFPRPSGISSCSGNRAGMECIWQVDVPSCDANVQGDPHFKTWSGEKFDFHGACDLVLLSNPGFSNDLGMDIHIRTTRVEEVYSYISGAVIKIGKDTLEVKGDEENVQYWINGVLGVTPDHDTTLDQTLSGFEIKYRQIEEENRDFLVYLQDGNGYYGTVAITTWNGYVGVDIYDSTESSFGTSVGLLGSYTTGERVGRDGKLVADVNEFGLEWQVRDVEGQLFHNEVGPQYPQKCVIPSVAEMEQHSKNYSISLEDAENACAGVPDIKRDQCIFDVRQTSDVHMARVYI